MALGLDAWIRQMLDLDLQSQVLSAFLHHVRQFQHVELFRELIEDAEFARPGGVETREFNAADGVSNIKESARLAALAIDRERISQGRLGTEAVQHRAKDLVVVEA